MRIVLIGLILLTATPGLKAQGSVKPDTNAVKSINGILKEVLRLQSGEKGQGRNWAALRDLFLPTATFTILNPGDTARPSTETVSLDDFIELLHDSYYEDGYLEYETGKTIEEFNGIANVFQSFYGKDSKGEEARGINSYQLVYFKGRWWIVNLLWTLETDKVKIPKRYLRKN